MSSEDIIFLFLFLGFLIPSAYLLFPKKNSETKGSNLKAEDADKE
jgi:hypothetical protein